MYDPISGTWSVTASMAQGRYYPTLTALPNGDVLVVSGNDENRDVVTIPEVFNGSTWRRLTTAPLSIGNPFYPDMFVAPDGRVFLAGFPATSDCSTSPAPGRGRPSGPVRSPTGRWAPR